MACARRAPCRLPSMAFSDSGNMLVSAKAVSDTYPLRGDVIIADAPFIRGAPIQSGPQPGEVWLESRALPALGLEVGDSGLRWRGRAHG